MSCQSNNATPPTPAIAPGAAEIDPAEVARRLAEAGPDPRLTAHVPDFDAPFFQAGLAGYSDPAMRLIARRHGCPLCVTEALLDRTLLAGGRGFAKADLGEIEDNIPGGADDHPLVGQIMGSEPAEMAAAAIKMVEQASRKDRDYRLLAECDARPSPGGLNPAPGVPPASPAEPDRQFAAIDVNLACPVKKIRSKARGGHWLAQPDGAIAILRAVRDALPESIPCTVKLRRAYDDTPEMARAGERILDAAFDLGYAWATVHARTVQQKYVGPSRWDLLRTIVQRHPGRCILGSGDVWTAEDIFRMIDYTGVTGVSVARGCIGNPWIFRQARQLMAGEPPAPPTLEEQRAVLDDHFTLALRVHAGSRNPELHTAKAMRKFGIRFAAHHPRHDHVRRLMTQVASLDDWRELLETHYPAHAEAREPGVVRA